MVDIETAISQLKSSAKMRQLVAIVGTGVSIALTDGRNKALSWRGLIENGFDYGFAKGRISAEQKNAWASQLRSNDLDDLLSASEFMGRKLDAPAGDLYGRWLEGVFKEVVPDEKGMANAIRALKSAEIPICTLNYDSLLERVTGLRAINLAEVTKVVSWIRREEQGILHLHGTWDVPLTCILGIRDYQATIADDVRDLVQRALTSFGRILFIGCGDTFADPNFSALIKWLRFNIRTAAPQHYALVTAADEARRHADPTWHGFVEPISFGVNHKDLPAFLLSLFPTAIAPKVRSKAVRSRASIVNARHSKVLADYCTFLLRDCGQMTIEGIRADMDTTQRRFDLERLFVPLKILAVPPEIPLNDPEREQKLLKWQESNKEPLSFGRVFENQNHLALLALPGGGKTLLLKRLAVAYADPARRSSTSDELPDLDVIPVLIRCREWKEYITRPISMLLRSIATITGQTSLADFSDALLPLLKRGQVLLLIDGLDEIHDDADRSTFVENLEKFLDEHDRIRLVVTSREAGFSLVAPAIARFCQRWKVAPLAPDAIKSLCQHWHQLMAGETPESVAEARDVAERLLQTPSLHRLAENPLLLTMLLVVKHGGRLPPDRVSLYDRAVEVLLDTWNIKGHEPLNLKEAVPQLACVAYELMRKGKQTATEKDLLALLEEAREKVPQIRRYAKDTPDQFLKRVELRSSLLVEAGHQLDGARTVPFYQFRHLTFQEHLAAVAAVEGHYLDYEFRDTVLKPLAPYLLAEEWKEVIPMAAVLAKKQAEPLIASLVAEGELLRRKLENGEDFPGKADWSNKIPAPIARFAQCLAEEAEVSSELLTRGLQLLALFARGCQSGDYWQNLARGPYGEELCHQAWKLYEPMQWPSECWLRNTLGAFYLYRKHTQYWQNPDGQKELSDLLRSEKTEDICRAALTIGGLAWAKHGRVDFKNIGDIRSGIEYLLFDERPAVLAAALWTWVLNYRPENESVVDHVPLMNRLLTVWTSYEQREIQTSAGYALAVSNILPRDEWKPVLSDRQKEFLRKMIDAPRPYEGLDRDVFAAASVKIGFYARSVWSEEELGELLPEVHLPFSSEGMAAKMLQQMGEAGLKGLRAIERRDAKRRVRAPL